METDNKNQELKRLGFVKIAAINALFCVSRVYEYAKQNSGPLRSTVGTVEGAVTAVVGPVYEKFKGVPSDLLVFLDKKVDEATHEFDAHAPPMAKQVTCQAHGLIQKALEKAQKFIQEAQTGGPRAAVHYATSEYKQFLLSQTVKIWVFVNQVPPLHAVAEMAVPMVARWSEKYNHKVKDMTEKGCTVFGYLPLVPVHDIAKEFKQVEAEKKRNGECSSEEHKSSDSDSD